MYTYNIFLFNFEFAGVLNWGFLKKLNPNIFLILLGIYTKLFQNKFMNSYLDKNDISFIFPLLYFILELSHTFWD